MWRKKTRGEFPCIQLLTIFKNILHQWTSFNQSLHQTFLFEKELGYRQYSITTKGKFINATFKILISKTTHPN